MDAPLRHILIVDDSPEDRVAIQRLLRTTPGSMTISEAERGDQALAICQTTPLDCVLLDYRLPAMDGMEVLARLRAQQTVPVILLTGMGNEALAVEALQHGAQDYLVKGMFTAERLCLTIERAIASVQAADRLRAQEEQFRAIIENGNVGVVLIGADQQTRYVSPTVRTLLGYPSEGFAATRIRSLCHPDDWPQHDAFVRTLTAYAGATAHTTTRLQHQDGTWRWMEAHGTNQTHNPAIKAIIVNFHDVTERVNAEDAAATALGRLDAIVANSPNGISYVDRDLRYVLVNPALAALNHRSPAEHLGRRLPELFPRMALWLEPLLRQVLATGTALCNLEREGQPDSQSGIAPTWQCTLYPVLGPDGEVVGVGVNTTDLTQRKRTEAALRASETRFRLLAEHAHDVIFRYRLTPSFQLEYLSSAIEALTGYPREAFYHDPQLRRQLIHPDDLPLITQVFRDPACHQPISMRWLHQDGRLIWIELHSWLVSDDNGPMQAIEGIARDITARVEAETHLRAALAAEQAARTAAETAVQLRDQFLSIASHELKTPLTVLLGNAQLLQRHLTKLDQLEARDARRLTVLIEQVRRLDRLIAMLLDVSRIDTGHLSLERQPVDVRSLLLRLVDELQPTLVQHQVVLTLPDASLTVLGDKLQLEQLFQNLIHNGVKYSPYGGEVAVQGTATTTGVEVTVTDHGIGIATAELPLLFGRFFRASNTEALQISGLGIGLYLAHEIIEHHGGTLRVVSAEGAGSTFTVTLPWP